MSSFVCANQTMSIVADYISHVMTWKTPEYPICHDCPFEDSAPEKIFKVLSEFNMRAWASSVREHEPIAVLEKFPSYSPSLINFKKNIVSLYMVVKALECYLYQCAEGEEFCEDPIWVYLDDVERSLALYIVMKNKYYDLISWG